jgi:hypothetical protein
MFPGHPRSFLSAYQSTHDHLPCSITKMNTWLEGAQTSMFPDDQNAIQCGRKQHTPAVVVYSHKRNDFVPQSWPECGRQIKLYGLPSCCIDCWVTRLPRRAKGPTGAQSRVGSACIVILKRYAAGYGNLMEVCFYGAKGSDSGCTWCHVPRYKKYKKGEL